MGITAPPFAGTGLQTTRTALRGARDWCERPRVTCVIGAVGDALEDLTRRDRRPDLEALGEEGSDTTPLEKWEALKGLCVSEKSNPAKKQKRATVPELWKYETVFSQCYPRLDENVSKHRNHLLKSPFAAHPKTGRVCVPFDARQVASFDPTTVVTLRQLSYELDQYSGDDVPDLGKTSLAHSVRFFERDFLHPMMKSWARSRRDDASTRRAQGRLLGSSYILG